MNELLFVTIALIGSMVGAIYSSTLIIKTSKLITKYCKENTK
jgi:hypothetical protein